MADHVPTSSYFSEVAYSLSSTSTSILSNVSRNVKPCHIVAIMGTLSAREVSGTVLVNGREKIVGYVDRDSEDTLMIALTVYETVLYSALLRLSRSREINNEARKFRMLEMLAELGILDIKDAHWG
ncbi:hypothetical protein BDN70DRAFT_885516 [Pholiota conissans]|uniref:Uncharacterized protein n=1 Tax=Pholiota conissans TaxID=109636 RepID=A0A9P6CV36_9AGAR|nr:hypothetical protein BDN70DRAFT_885516 [Pholiota conissans]